MSETKFESQVRLILDRGDIETAEAERLRSAFRTAPAGTRRLVLQIQRLGRARREGRLIGDAWIAAKEAVLDDIDEFEVAENEAPCDSERIEIRRRLYSLERAWRVSRARFVLRDRRGGEMLPTKENAILGAITVFVLLMIILVGFSNIGSRPLGWRFALPALLPTIVISAAVYRSAQRQVREFEASEERFRRERRELRARLKTPAR